MMLNPIYVSGSVAVKRTPFRLRVLRALTTALEGVNPDNGYLHDLRGAVFRGRVRYDRDDPIPMVSILEAPIPQEAIKSSGDNPYSSGKWELLIQGFVSDDKDNPSDPAHHLMAEVKAALVAVKRLDKGNNMLGMDGRVMEMDIGQGSVRPPDDATNEVFFWLTLRLQVAEALADPYY